MFGDARPAMPLGSQSVTFIRSYFRELTAIFRKISRAWIEDKAYLDDMVDMRFLRQEVLARDALLFDLFPEYVRDGERG